MNLYEFLDLLFEGKTYKYIDSKWKEIIDEEAFQLTKTEGQVSY